MIAQRVAQNLRKRFVRNQNVNVGITVIIHGRMRIAVGAAKYGKGMSDEYVSRINDTTTHHGGRGLR